MSPPARVRSQSSALTITHPIDHSLLKVVHCPKTRKKKERYLDHIPEKIRLRCHSITRVNHLEKQRATPASLSAIARSPSLWCHSRTAWVEAKGFLMTTSWWWAKVVSHQRENPSRPASWKRTSKLSQFRRHFIPEMWSARKRARCMRTRAEETFAFRSTPNPILIGNPGSFLSEHFTMIFVLNLIIIWESCNL